MTRPPTVSVVLIFYNDERFLPESIESVFAQTYDDWELILVDDGSTDGSSAIARDWEVRHPDRVRYLEHEGHANRGPAATRNVGWRHAGGRYIAILDSDDVWKPEKLAEQVVILDDEPTVGMVFGASEYWWSWAGDDAQRPDRVRPIGAPSDQAHHPPSLVPLLYPLGDGTPPCPSSWLLRRDLVERVGGWEEHLQPIYEDQGLLAKVYRHATVWVSSRCWDLYRRHPGQITMTTDIASHQAARREFLDWYVSYLRDEGIGDPTTSRLIRRATWPYRHPRLAAARHRAGRLRARLRR